MPSPTAARERDSMRAALCAREPKRTTTAQCRCLVWLRNAIHGVQCGVLCVDNLALNCREKWVN